MTSKSEKTLKGSLENLQGENIRLQNSIEDLRSTVAFLNKSRDAITSAAQVQKGELDRVKSNNEAALKNFSNNQVELAYLRADYEMLLNDVKAKNDEVNKLKEELESTTQQLIKARKFSSDNADAACRWMDKYHNKKELLFWVLCSWFISVVPYVVVGISWVVDHIGLCLH